jgi:LmbE family N-acetylglucosaminyl deacetylase
LLLSLLAAALAATARSQSAPTALPAADLPIFGATTSLLIVSPHPDDEVLCCAGVLQRVLAAGGRVTVVWITSGDASELDLLVIEKSLFVRPQKLRDLAEKRMQEARTAATLLGIPADRQIFLGYPDRGVLSLLTDHYLTPYYSRYNGSSAVPYDTTLSPGHDYTGVNLERDFDTVIQRTRPTLVLAPSPRDAHPDHQGAGILAMRAMSRRGGLSKLRYWVVHGGETWPLPRGYHPALPQHPSPRGRGLSPGSFLLTQQEEDRKLEALRSYQTQMRVMASYLLSYVRSTELYSDTPMPPPSPNQPLAAESLTPSAPSP